MWYPEGRKIKWKSLRQDFMSISHYISCRCEIVKKKLLAGVYVHLTLREYKLLRIQKEKKRRKEKTFGKVYCPFYIMWMLPTENRKKSFARVWFPSYIVWMWIRMYREPPPPQKKIARILCWFYIPWMWTTENWKNKKLKKLKKLLIIVSQLTSPVNSLQ